MKSQFLGVPTLLAAVHHSNFHRNSIPTPPWSTPPSIQKFTPPLPPSSCLPPPPCNILPSINTQQPYLNHAFNKPHLNPPTIYQAISNQLHLHLLPAPCNPTRNCTQTSCFTYNFHNPINTLTETCSEQPSRTLLARSSLNTPLRPPPPPPPAQPCR